MKGLIYSAVALMEPLGLIWLVLISGAVWKFYKKEKRDAWVLTAIVFFIWLIGATSLTGMILARLEKPYAGLKIENLPDADAIVLLGGGRTPSRYEVQGMHLKSSGGDRLLMAHSLARRGKAPVLLIVGPSFKHQSERLSEPAVTRKWFEIEAGITNAIVMDDNCFSTTDEALVVQRLAKVHEWKSILMVTSAYHMRRASAVYRTHLKDLEIHEVPCDFQTIVGRYGANVMRIVPKLEGFSRFSLYFHELIGWYYYRLRGWIDSEAAAQKTPSFKQ